MLDGRARLALLGAGLGVGLLGAGCAERQVERMATGSVDSTKLLRYDEDYQKLAQAYVKERTALAVELSRAVRQAGGTLPAPVFQEFSQREGELASRWMARTREFVKSRADRIGVAAGQVASEKGLDLVILDSEELPTVEYGAVDVTEDVLGALPGLAGGGAAPSTVEATAAPAPEEAK